MNCSFSGCWDGILSCWRGCTDCCEDSSVKVYEEGTSLTRSPNESVNETEVHRFNDKTPETSPRSYRDLFDSYYAPSTSCVYRDATPLFSCPIEETFTKEEIAQIKLAENNDVNIITETQAQIINKVLVGYAFKNNASSQRISNIILSYLPLCFDLWKRIYLPLQRDRFQVILLPEKIAKTIAGYLLDPVEVSQDSPPSNNESRANVNASENEAFKPLLAQQHIDVSLHMCHLFAHMAKQTTLLYLPKSLKEDIYSLAPRVNKNISGFEIFAVLGIYFQNLESLSLNFEQINSMTQEGINLLKLFPRLPQLLRLTIQNTDTLSPSAIGELFYSNPPRFPKLKSLYLTNAKNLMNTKNRKTFSEDFIDMAKILFQYFPNLHKIQNDDDDERTHRALIRTENNHKKISEVDVGKLKKKVHERKISQCMDSARAVCTHRGSTTSRDSVTVSTVTEDLERCHIGTAFAGTPIGASQSSSSTCSKSTSVSNSPLI